MKICKKCIAKNIVQYFEHLYGEQLADSERKQQEDDVVTFIEHGIIINENDHLDVLSKKPVVFRKLAKERNDVPDMQVR